MDKAIGSFNISDENSSFPIKPPIFDLTPVLVAGYFELLVCIIGVPANLLVLYLWTLIGRKGNESLGYDTRVHNNNHWFILGVTLADLVFTSIHAPLIAAWFISSREYNTCACLLLVSITHTSTTASSINVLLLNIDKFLYLNKPLHYYDLVTKKRAITALVIGWIVAICWALFFTFGPLTKFSSACSRMEVTRPLEYICFAIFFFILPISGSFCISVYIATITIRASKDMTNGYTRPNDAKCQKRGSMSSRRSSTLSSRLKTLAFIFTTTAWCTVTCLPYRFAYTLHSANVVKYTKHLWLYYIFYIMMAMTAAGNPFITIFTQPNYRRQLMKLIRIFKEKKKAQNLLYEGMMASSPGHGSEQGAITTTYHVENSN